MVIIKLQSNDGVVFPVDEKIVECSKTIKTMLDNLGIEDDSKKEPIPLSNVHSTVLAKIIQWATHHKDDPPYIEKNKDKEKTINDMSPWDADFFKIDGAMLFEVIQAANYLNIKPLLEAACKAVANTIKGRTPEELRTVFNIEKDFTPEEEEEIRKEKEWCEETKVLFH